MFIREGINFIWKSIKFLIEYHNVVVCVSIVVKMALMEVKYFFCARLSADIAFYLAYLRGKMY